MKKFQTLKQSTTKIWRPSPCNGEKVTKWNLFKFHNLCQKFGTLSSLNKTSIRFCPKTDTDLKKLYRILSCEDQKLTE
jgi:hypothetical protein